MMIHLALDDLPDWRAGAELRNFAYVHVAPDLEMMSRVYAEASAGLAAGRARAGRRPADRDRSLARARGASMCCGCRCGCCPPISAATRCGEIPTRPRWDEAKEPYAERVLDILEAHAPGLRGQILGRAVFSPLDLERENPNLIGGDNLSGSHHLDQNFFLRPVAGYSRYKTPVRNLYLCGASTWPGAGTGAGSGFMLAKMLAG